MLKWNIYPDKLRQHCDRMVYVLTIRQECKLSIKLTK
jgi:hypothetical protein